MYWGGGKGDGVGEEGRHRKGDELEVGFGLCSDTRCVETSIFNGTEIFFANFFFNKKIDQILKIIH